MLTEKEKNGCREILNKLDVDDLIALTDTVSNRSVSVENRNEALDAILLFSSNPLQLLKRKKVKREHLYIYLAENKYVPAPSADKATLIRKILDLWGTSKETLTGNNDSEEEDGFNDNDGTITKGNNQRTNHSSTTVENLDCQMLSQHFIKWYYKAINSLVMPSESSSEWGAQHFWSDSKLTLVMSSGNMTYDECEGALAVSEKLHHLVQSEKIYFNPFVEGVQGQLNGYGLVRVSTGGTVHRYSQCIGIFEQSFGLIQDPNMGNNWKIKFTELKMKASGGNEIEGHGVPAIGSS